MFSQLQQHLGHIRIRFATLHVGISQESVRSTKVLGLAPLLGGVQNEDFGTATRSRGIGWRSGISVSVGVGPHPLEPWTRRRSVQVGLVWPKPNKSSRRPSLGSRRASARSGIGVSVRSRVVRWLVWVPGMRFDRPGAPCCPDHRFIVVTAREPRRAYIPAREPQQAIRQGTHDKIPCTLRWVRKRRS